MKTISLTRGRVAMVDDGDFVRLSNFNWHAVGPMGGGNWYAARHAPPGEKGPLPTKVYMHHEVLGRRIRVDHIDGNGLNNQSDNLREGTASQNKRNAKKFTRLGKCSSRFKGVHWSARYSHWRVAISAGRGVKEYLGFFGNEEDAARAYDARARSLFGEFAAYNFPQEGERAAALAGDGPGVSPDATSSTPPGRP